MNTQSREYQKLSPLVVLFVLVFFIGVSQILIIMLLQSLFEVDISAPLFRVVGAGLSGVFAGTCVYFLLIRPHERLLKELSSAHERVEDLSSLGKVVFYNASIVKSRRGTWLPVVTLMSRSAEEVLGLSMHDVPYDVKLWMERIHPQDREKAIEKAYSVFEVDTVDQTYRFMDGRGKYQWVRDRSVLLRDEKGTPRELRGVWVVVTDQVKREVAYARQSRRLETLLEASKRINRAIDLAEIMRSLALSAISLVDSESGATGIFSGGRMIFTEYVTGEEVRPVNYSFSPGEGVPGWVMEHRKPYLTNDALNDSQVIREIQQALGFRNLIDVPILDTAGNLLGCFEIHNKRGGRDYTEEDVRLLEALADSAAIAIQNGMMVKRLKDAMEEHSRLFAAVEQAGEIVMITSPEGDIQYVNPAFERITGYSREEAIENNPRFLKSGFQNAEFYEKLWTTITSGRTWNGRFVNRRKDGSTYEEEAVISPVFGAQGDIINFVAVKRDVTEKVVLENQLRQSQKLEAVGRLAGGIAHDINNFLAALTGYAEIIRMRYTEDDFLQEKAGRMLEAISKSSDLILQLLAFSRKQPSEPKIVNPNRLLEKLESMLSRLIGERIEFRMVFSPGVWNLKLDPLHLEQVMVNLVVNARDAMPEGGELVVETKNVVFDETYREKRKYVVPGEYVMISVSDTGVGIPKELQDKIFEPFFTTKGRETGSGLGLSTVYGIVKQNGGYIWVYSEEGRGTSFEIYLPRCREEVEEDDVGERLRTAETLGGLKVLYVEDNTVVREATHDFLTQAGCIVETAEDGPSALKLVEKEGLDFDFLITDVVMPRMSGRELADILKKRNPHLKVLFTTGYSDEEVIRYGVSAKDEVLLKKPFRSGDLVEKIRLLQGDSSSPS